MEFTEALPNCGRLIPYCPALAEALGSKNAALLLAQLLYWRGKEAEPELGIYKTQAELTKETRLTRYEQETAFAKLQQLGLVTMNYRRMQHRMYYLLQMDAINSFWENYQGNPSQEMALPEATKATFANVGKQHSRESNIRECGKATLPNVGKQHSGVLEGNIRSLLTHEMTPEITSGEHTHEMVQASVELAVGFAGLEEWLQREAR